ncbi:MAG: hypothetical protein ACPGJV_03245 [Bacteriovoracaceae bacterium]
MKRYTIFFFISFLSLQVFANTEKSIIAVGEAELEKLQVFISGPFNSEGKSLSHQKWLRETFVSNFKFYQKYFEVSSSDFDLVKPEGFKGTFIKIEVNNSNQLQVLFHQENGEKFQITSEQVLSQNSESDRSYVHEISHDIYKRLTGKSSIFKSRIFSVCETKKVGRDAIKELFVMDFDGKRRRQLTRHNGLVISPAASVDGRKVIYSLINDQAKRRNINLHLFDLKTRKSEIISSRKGINSGAVFLPGGKEIYLTLSHRGNADIFKLNLATKNLTPITGHYALDVDPSISYDGRLITFLSDRPGKPMIYTMDPSMKEKNVKRISFVGKYNATPRFSPDGKEIVFSSWLDSRFDLFRIGSDGSNLVRLTKDFGSNEDPTYSVDGEFIAFSSQRVITSRKAVQVLYIMDRDGKIIGNITPNDENCISPRWTN